MSVRAVGTKQSPHSPPLTLHSTRTLSHSHSSALSPVAAAGVLCRCRRHGSLPAIEDAVMDGEESSEEEELVGMDLEQHWVRYLLCT